MRRICLGEERRCVTIVLVVLWRVGLGIVELWKFELVNAGENHRWSCESDDLALCDLVHSPSSLMCPSRSGVLAGLVGKIWADLT